MLRKAIYIAYKKLAPANSWHVVGLLSYDEDRKRYSFQYTKGALGDSTFKKFEGMENLYAKYYSEDLPPLFKNRILNPRRPEYPMLMQWLGLPLNANPIDVLSLTGGLRITDSLQTFCEIVPDKRGFFEHTFFVHGLSWLIEHQRKRVDTLKKGELLLLCPDPQNEYDHSAVMIRSENPRVIIGNCPRYLAKTLTDLLKIDHTLVKVEVDIVNKGAPLQYKLRCKLKGRLPPGISFNTEEFKPIV